MFAQPCPPEVINEDIHLFIDPAGGGPHSDYAIVSITRAKGIITVSPPKHTRTDLPPTRKDHMSRRRA